MRRLGAAALILIGVALSALYMKTCKPNGDYTQMYERALLLVDHGVWTHHGNVASGALLKNIPGTFLTFITAAPMWLVHSVYAPNALIVMLGLVALGLLAQIMRETFGRQFTIFPLIILFWLNPWRVAESVLWNPAYLPFFAVLFLWSAWRMRNSRNFAGSFFLTLTVGFAFQVHLSAMILAILALLLTWKRKIHISWAGVLAAVVLLILSVLPYALDLAAHPQAYLNLPSDPSDYNNDHFFMRNLVFVYPLIKTLSYWVRFPTLYLPRSPLVAIKMSWVEPYGVPGPLLEYPYKLALLVGTAVSAVIGTWGFFSFIEGGHRILRKVRAPSLSPPALEANPDYRWLRSFFTLAFWASIVATAISPIELNYWQLILCMPFALIPIYTLFATVRTPNVRHYLQFLGVMFILHCFFSAMESKLHDYRIDFKRDFFDQQFPHAFSRN